MLPRQIIGSKAADGRHCSPYSSTVIGSAQMASAAKAGQLSPVMTATKRR